MAFPVVAGLAVASGIGAVANSVRGIHQGLETRKYWRDYENRTGFRPRYPVRSGLYDTVYGAFGYAGSVTGLGVRGIGAYASWETSWQKPVSLDNHSYYA